MKTLICKEDAAKIICDWCGICPEGRRNIEECEDVCPQFAKIPSVRADAYRKWTPIEKGLPKTGDPVLATCKSNHGEYVCKAAWIECLTLETGSWDSERSEYNEEDDEYYAAEGWYEYISNWYDYQYIGIDDEVIAWMPLPEPYKGE